LNPVGTIREFGVSTNPATLLGFGTWELHGVGKTTVCIDSSDTDFDTLGETRGAKTHTLIIAEIPAHNHNEKFRTPDGTTGAWTIQYNTNGAVIVTTENAGGGGAHNNIQPSIVTYRWIRTA
jgi:microcystin-dependent protein